MTPLRASVIVPALNAAQALPRCLKALASQSYPRAEYEIIVVDDGSTDDTSRVAAQAGADHVLTCPHRGPAAARNAGIAQAQGEVILFTDADCEPEAGWLAEMLRPFDDPRVAGVKGSYKTRQTEVVARLAQCEFEERYDLLARLPAIDFIDTYAAAFRASVLRAIGGFDPAFPQANNEDVDLSYRLAEHGHRLIFNRGATVYHRHVAGWRAYARLKARRGYWRMMVYRLHPGKAVRDSYTPQVMKLQILLVYLAVVCAAGAFWRPLLAWGILLSLAGLVLSGWRFIKLVGRRDRGVAVWAPAFILVRALAFAVGSAAGVIGMLSFRPTLAAPGAGGRREPS
jgi:glycosyltransferase involved in cell wall biosynthesis